jgi:acyl-coenzyme A thioesterase PaaI-like protein
LLETGSLAVDISGQQNINHPDCFVCSPSSAKGLSVHFRAEPDGSISASFCGSPEHEGYPGLLHGGITASLLDGAMTNCLFAHGQVGLTVELNVRYRAPVACCEECAISAKLEDCRHGVSRLTAQLMQNGVVKAIATGKFMPKPSTAPQQP